uniref:Uncharacterized protein n=1 Tax=Arundo donax TaxID=35708 RepID=A0A0A9G2A7_ARUDO
MIFICCWPSCFLTLPQLALCFSRISSPNSSKMVFGSTLICSVKKTILNYLIVILMSFLICTFFSSSLFRFAYVSCSMTSVGYISFMF